MTNYEKCVHLSPWTNPTHDPFVLVAWPTNNLFRFRGLAGYRLPCRKKMHIGWCQLRPSQPQHYHDYLINVMGLGVPFQLVKRVCVPHICTRIVTMTKLPLVAKVIDFGWNDGNLTITMRMYEVEIKFSFKRFYNHVKGKSDACPFGV